MTKTPSATKNRQDEVPVEDLLKRLVLTGADIVRIGEDAELLVGGKNYNTALISRVEGVRIPQFRAISSVAFHIVLDECKVCAALIRSMVDEAYNRIDWASPEVTKDHELVWEFISPYWGQKLPMNMVYRAYRVPYEWVPQLGKQEETPIERIDVNAFRMPGAAALGDRVSEIAIEGCAPYEGDNALCVASVDDPEDQ